MKPARLLIPKRATNFAVAVAFLANCLAGAAEGETTASVLHFPKDRSMGMLYTLDAGIERKIKDFHHYVDGTEMMWEYLGEATGDVAVPAGKRVTLRLNKVSGTDLSPLAQLGANDLHQLHLSESTDGRSLSQIKNLTGLKVLSFQWTHPAKPHHRFTPADLKQLAPLKSLERLRVPEHINDAGLATLAESLPQLRTLYFSKNDLTDPGLTALSKFTQLEELSIGGDRITGRSLGILTNLPSLHFLDLWGDTPKDDALREIRKITSLKSLNLPNTITDAGLPYLAGHPSLETLSLFNAKVTDRGMVHLRSLHSLKKLDLTKRSFDRNSPPITDAATLHLKEIKTLEVLRLPAERLTDQGLANLVELDKLKTLDLPMAHYVDPKLYLSPYTEKGIQDLAGIRSLESLSIAGPGVTDAALSHVAQMTNLHSLMLFGCAVSDEGMSRLIALQSLKSFTLLSAANVTVVGFNHLNKLPSLTNLQASISARNGVALNIARLTRLKYLMLSIDKGPAFRDEDLACLTGLKQLKSLQLGSMDLEITDAGMAHLARLTSVERLVLGGPAITDRGLAVLTNMARLDLVKISGTFTDAGLQKLATLTGLRSLWIYSATNFSPSARERLHKSLPNIYHFTAEQGKSGSAGISATHPKPGTPAPDFTVTTLDGAKFTLSEQRGKVVLLHFWATWCAPCIKGLPAQKTTHARLKQKYGDRVVLVDLAMDDDETKLRRVVATHRLVTPQARIGMRSPIAASYGVVGAPDDFMIGPDGRILLNRESPESSEDTEAVIDKALGLTKAPARR